MAVKIKLTKGYEALVDEEDYERINAYKWHAEVHKNNVYAITNFSVNKKPIHVKMESLVLGYKVGHIIDHIKSNGLDNRCENLRFATDAQNARNRKKYARNGIPYKGVYKDKRRDCYFARLTVNSKVYKSHQTKNMHLAALWYNIFVLQYTEGFGILNDVPPHACLD